MADSEVNAGDSDLLDRCFAHGLYCVLEVLDVSENLLVWLNCLPLVLRDRVFGVLQQSRSLWNLAFGKFSGSGWLLGCNGH